MRYLIAISMCTLWLSVAGMVIAQIDPTDDLVSKEQPQNGLYETTFTKRSPLSSVESITERFRYELKQPLADYILAEESFSVYVPESYDGTEPYGLLVWINAGAQGQPPQEYQVVLDHYKLIWVSANNSGNDRNFWHRAGLALDGMYNIKQQYRIDPMRTYISGISGGGRSASRVGLIYADEFAGMFAIIGVDFFTRLPHEDSTATRLVFWAPAFMPPSPHILRRAKRDGRYVLLTGETDGNRIQTLTTYQYGYQRAKFEHVTYLEVPGMGHALPPNDWFAKGIDALDEPLAEIRERREKKAGILFERAQDTLRRSTPHGIEAMQELLRDYNDTSYAPPAQQALDKALADQPTAEQIPETTKSDEPQIDKAREDLALAKNYTTAGRKDLAIGILRGLIAKYPDSDEADAARLLLDELNNYGDSHD